MSAPDRFYAIKTYNFLTDNGIPIEGVSIGRLDDKSTWRIDFMAEATSQQRADALLLIRDFDPDSVSDPVSEVESLRAQISVLTSQLNNIPLEKSAPKKKK
jgi:hypothetical protein